MVVAYYIVVIIIDTYLIVIAGVITAGILMLMGFLKDRFYLKKPIKKIMILGSKGKMGKYFVNAFKEKYLILEVDQNETLTFMNALEQKPDLILDFSLAGEETSLYLKEALKKRIPIISGVTGRKKEVFRELEKLSRKYKTSFIYKPNYTKGIFFIKEWLESISDFGLKNVIYLQKKMLHQVQHFILRKLCTYRPKVLFLIELKTVFQLIKS